jgi:hypothetical protein
VLHLRGTESLGPRQRNTHITNARPRPIYWETCSSPLHKAGPAEVVIPRDTADGRRPSNRSIASGEREKRGEVQSPDNAVPRNNQRSAYAPQLLRTIHWTPLVQNTYIDTHELGAFRGPSLPSLYSSAQSASCVTKSCRLTCKSARQARARPHGKIRATQTNYFSSWQELEPRLFAPDFLPAQFSLIQNISVTITTIDSAARRPP